jgi:ribose transport system permease protein
MCVVFASFQPIFLTVSNFQNVTRQISVLIILALGETIVLIAGGLDLSIGSIVGLSGITAALFSGKLGIVPGISIGVIIGATAGATNGILISRFRIPSIITTLGMLSVARGITYIISDGRSITDVPRSYRYLAEAYLGPIPMPVLIAAVLFLIVQVLLAQTSFGRRVYAMGVNRTAAWLSGTPVARIELIVFTISGLLAGIGGVLLSSRTVSGQPTAGSGFELQVITAVVLGGVSLFGGRGKLWRAMIGVLFIGLLGNGLNLLDVSPYTQTMVTGIALIIALASDQSLIGAKRDPWE